MIPGKPVPKARPRVVRRGGKVRTFTPKRTTDYERHVAWCLQQLMLDRKYADAPDWPATTGRFAVALRVYGAHGSADMDNVAKSVLDGAEGNNSGSLWVNDKQVTRLTVERCAKDAGGPRVECVVEVIP